MSKFFIDKFSSVRNSFFSLNAFGFKPGGGVSPFLQAYIYESFCISRILYGLEIMHIIKNVCVYIKQNEGFVINNINVVMV